MSSRRYGRWTSPRTSRGHASDEASGRLGDGVAGDASSSDAGLGAPTRTRQQRQHSAITIPAVITNGERDLVVAEYPDQRRHRRRPDRTAPRPSSAADGARGARDAGTVPPRGRSE